MSTALGIFFTILMIVSLACSFGSLALGDRNGMIIWGVVFSISLAIVSLVIGGVI